MMYIVSPLISVERPSGSTKRPEPFCTSMFCESSVAPGGWSCLAIHNEQPADTTWAASRPPANMAMRFMMSLVVVSAPTVAPRFGAPRAVLKFVHGFHRLSADEGTSQTRAWTRGARSDAGNPAGAARLLRAGAVDQRVAGRLARLPDVPQAAAPQAGPGRRAHHRAGEARHHALRQRSLHRVALGQGARVGPRAHGSPAARLGFPRGALRELRRAAARRRFL